MTLLAFIEAFVLRLVGRHTAEAPTLTPAQKSMGFWSGDPDLSGPHFTVPHAQVSRVLHGAVSRGEGN